ncbi:hypothetical protein PAXRUDRAFT_22227 [Paxillus rubicundulus Ve08.2h10]|uniref:Unplaced genomic scaffold scaffold_6245, whole genome shotgun sequence n=1 Tax=Paxillus rubicundulus Ve08.2h10 TaxID=930991 RepID=A0A0D0CXT9_9AGAM|nr:hypothetical protein PAXRUDRAFT_22227 [Paxillus rubicundulus Ve08.2h10]
MSSSTTNDLTKWSDEQLHKNKDDDNELFEKKSAEHRRRTKARKEAERRMAEEVARRKAEEEAKRKGEVKAQRRAEAEVKVRAEEVVQAQSSTSGPSKGKQPRVTASGTMEVTELVGGLAPCYGCLDLGVVCEMRVARSSKARSCDRCRRLRNKCEWPGDAQPSQWRKREEVMSPQARKKKVQMKSSAVEDEEEDVEDCKVEENRDALSTLVEVLSVMVGEMRNMAADRRCMAAESHAQMERVLGTLEEIWGCLDPEFIPEEPEEGSEENFDEGEVAEAAKEREALKGWNEEEEEVDESV